MCWQCDNPHGTTDEYMDSLRDTIADHGWVVQFVESEQRPFAYTIGLHERGLPELLITGLQAQTSARLLNSIAHQIVDDGTTLQPAMHIDYQGEFLLEVVEVEHPDVHLKFAVSLCGGTSARINLYGRTTTAVGRGIAGGAMADAGNRYSVSAHHYRMNALAGIQSPLSGSGRSTSLGRRSSCHRTLRRR